MGPTLLNPPVDFWYVRALHSAIDVDHVRYLLEAR